MPLRDDAHGRADPSAADIKETGDYSLIKQKWLGRDE